MPSVYAIKPQFQNLLRPCVATLARRGITANQVTVAACLASVVYGAALALRPGAALLLGLPAFLLLRMAFNAIDGMLAREFRQQSSLGALLNELTDVVADAALYLPFALLPGLPATLVVLFALLAVVSEMAGVVAQTIGATRRYDGPMGKSDRALAVAIIAVLYACGWTSQPWMHGLFVVLDLLLVCTIVNRCHQALKNPPTSLPRPA